MDGEVVNGLKLHVSWAKFQKKAAFSKKRVTRMWVPKKSGKHLNRVGVTQTHFSSNNNDESSEMVLDSCENQVNVPGTESDSVTISDPVIAGLNRPQFVGKKSYLDCFVSGLSSSVDEGKLGGHANQVEHSPLDLDDKLEDDSAPTESYSDIPLDVEDFFPAGAKAHTNQKRREKSMLKAKWRQVSDAAFNASRSRNLKRKEGRCADHRAISSSNDVPKDIENIEDIDAEVARRAVVVGGRGGLRIMGDHNAAIEHFKKEAKKKKTLNFECFERFEQFVL